MISIISIQTDQPSDAYHRSTAVSSGAIRAAADPDLGPEAYRHYVDSKHDEKAIGKPWEGFGHVVHTLALEPEKIGQVATIGEDTARARNLRSAYDPFFRDSIDKPKINVSADMLGAAHAVIPHLKQVWRNCVAVQNEVSIYWLEDGVTCKARLDTWGIQRGRTIIGDIKGLRDISAGAWSAECRARRYRLQAAHYVTGAFATVGEDPAEWNVNTLEERVMFLFFTAQKTEPHSAIIRSLNAETLYRNLQHRKDIVAMIRERTESGDWSNPETVEEA